MQQFQSLIGTQQTNYQILGVLKETAVSIPYRHPTNQLSNLGSLERNSCFNPLQAPNKQALQVSFRIGPLQFQSLIGTQQTRDRVLENWIAKEFQSLIGTQQTVFFLFRIYFPVWFQSLIGTQQTLLLGSPISTIHLCFNPLQAPNKLPSSLKSKSWKRSFNPLQAPNKPQICVR